MAKPEVVFYDAEYAKIRRAIGYGMQNLGLAIQGNAVKRFQDVGGPLPRPASLPGESPVVQTGFLRRSIHTAVWIAGEKLFQSQPSIPDYAGETEGAIVLIVGTNTGYGLYLEVGTGKMAARPFLTPAYADVIPQAEGLVSTGAARHYTP